MMARLRVLGADPERTRVIARAGLDVLLSEPRADGSNVAAIGYCFGGTVALELARGGAALKAVVGFHPGLSTVRPEDAGNITGRVLMFVGSEDPFVPLDQRLAFEAEMRAGGVYWEMVLYGGAEHSFAHPGADPEVTGLPGIKYDARAAARSWQTMLELFDEVFD
jgi:dienelactone hydrolase